MAHLLVWILIFAGVTLGLLAIFLMVSEKELEAQLDENAEREAESTARSTFASAPNFVGEPLSRAVEAVKAQAKEIELAMIRREVAEQTRLYAQLKDDNLRLREELIELRRQTGARGRNGLGGNLLNEPAAQQTFLMAPQSGAGEFFDANNSAPIALNGTPVADSINASRDGSYGEHPLMPYDPSARKPGGNRGGKVVAMAIVGLALGTLAAQALAPRPDA